MLEQLCLCHHLDAIIDRKMLLGQLLTSDDERLQPATRLIFCNFCTGVVFLSLVDRHILRSTPRSTRLGCINQLPILVCDALYRTCVVGLPSKSYIYLPQCGAEWQARRSTVVTMDLPAAAVSLCSSCFGGHALLVNNE